MARKAGYDREKVLDKALELFWAKGYHGTSLKDLEVALGGRLGYQQEDQQADGLVVGCVEHDQGVAS